MDGLMNDAAVVVIGFILVVLILRVTVRPAMTERVSSIVRHRIELRDHLVSIVGEDEAYRLLRAVSAQMGKPPSDVTVLTKCIDLAKKDEANRYAAANQQRSGEFAGLK